MYNFFVENAIPNYEEKQTSILPVSLFYLPLQKGLQALSWLRRRAGCVVYVYPILIEIQLIKEK